MPAVIGAGKLDNHTPARRYAGKPHRHIDHIRACVQKRRHLCAGDDTGERFAELDLDVVGRAEHDPLVADGLRDAPLHMVVDVAQDARSGAIPVVDISIAVRIPDISAFSARYEVGKGRVVFPFALGAHRRGKPRPLP